MLKYHVAVCDDEKSDLDGIVQSDYYPVYFGYDAKGKICAVYVRFIDIEASYREQD